MQVQDYCKAMLAEVTAWKEKLEAMKKVADSYGTDQKEKILPFIGQLEQEVATAQMRVEKLETECPSDWSPIKNDLDDLFGTLFYRCDAAGNPDDGLLAVPDLEDLGACCGKLRVVWPLQSRRQRLRLALRPHHDTVGGDVDVERLGVAVVRVYDNHRLFA